MTTAQVHAAYLPRWQALAADARTDRYEAAAALNFHYVDYMAALDLTDALDRIIRHLYPETERQAAA